MTQFRYAEVIERLRAAYGESGAVLREAMVKEPWKLAEREAFRRRLAAAGLTRLLEIGAGTGQDSVYFRDSGLEVVATDLSESMVEHCRENDRTLHVARSYRCDGNRRRGFRFVSHRDA